METKRIELEDNKEFITDQVRAMSLKKHNNLLTSGRWSNKDPKYVQILSLVGVAQKLADD